MFVCFVGTHTHIYTSHTCVQIDRCVYVCLCVCVYCSVW